MFNREDFFKISLQESSELKLKILSECKQQIFNTIDILKSTIINGGKIMFCGNGGSAADSQHLATELIIRLSHDINRPAMAAIALTTDTSLITACSNDIGYDQIFERQIEALGNKGDVLVGISTSGNSKNVINAILKAREMGIKTVAFLGGSGGKLRGLADCEIIIPSNNTQRIQEGHITVGHIICETLERELYG